MQELNTDTRMEGAALVRVTALFEENQSGIYARTDRLLAKLMILQWMAGIAAALWVSPKTWAGASSQMHWHVWAAIFLGGVITSFPVWLAWKQPGRPLTRHTIAFAQMLTSGLLIHLTGGRIETHFHVFGSLAFLAFYRDWRVLITATVVVAVDHLLRGLFWPQSVYGVLAASSWRSVEHAGWVIFEDTFLIISIRQSLNEMFEVATRRAKLEALNTGIERQVTERTAELTREIAERIRGRAQLEAVIQAMQDGVMVFDTEGQAVLVNEAEARINGFASAAEMKQSLAFFAEIYELTDLAGKPIPVEQWPVSRILRGETVANWELRGRRNDTGQEWVFSFGGAPARDEQGKQILAVTITRDITERKRTEAELEKAQKDLVLASRQAGMAEVATGVLHNVGNVLNSANVTTSLISDNLKKSRISDLGKAVALLREHQADLGSFFTHDPKGQKLPEFLARLAERLAQEQADHLKELQSLEKNIAHIKDVVAMQQSYAKVSGVTEIVQVRDLVEDTLRMNASALARHDVRISRDYEEVPALTIDKHKLLQILVNLVRNAKYACDESGRSDKQVTMRVRNGNDRVTIAVIDNGIGIPAENMGRLFHHGFPTKRDGHGFGLHSGAPAAKELGGSLSAHSDGIGQGATFTLELPLESKSCN